MKITKEHGYPKIDKKYGRLLKTCLSKKEIRFAIQYIEVRKDSLVATDGKKLLVIYCEHNLNIGLYYLSSEFLLLKTESDKKFPKWEDIIKKDLKQIKIGYFYDQSILLSNLIYKINNAGVLINFDLYEPVMRKVAALGVSDMVLEVGTENAKNYPIQLKFTKGKDKFVFALMPLLKP